MIGATLCQFFSPPRADLLLSSQYNLEEILLPLVWMDIIYFTAGQTYLIQFNQFENTLLQVFRQTVKLG